MIALLGFAIGAGVPLFLFHLWLNEQRWQTSAKLWREGIDRAYAQSLERRVLALIIEEKQHAVATAVRSGRELLGGGH